MPLRQDENARIGLLLAENVAAPEIDVLFPEKLDAAAGRSQAGLVGIVDQDHPRGIPCEQPDVLRRQRRSESGDRVLVPPLVQRDQVEIALDDVDRAGRAALLLGPVKPVEGAPLAVERSLGGVEVFGGRVVHDPPAEPHHPGHLVDDREHDAFAEPVVEPAAVLARHDETGFFEQRDGEALAGHERQEVVPALRRIPDAEMADGLRPDPAALEVVPGPLSVGVAGKGPLEELERPAVDLEQLIALVDPAALDGRQRLFGQRNPAAAGKRAGRFGKGDPVALHDETENVPPGPAAEAVEDLFPGIHRERGCFFRMEGAEAAQIFPGLFQDDRFRDDIDDIRCLADLRYFFVRDVRCQ